MHGSIIRLWLGFITLVDVEAERFAVSLEVTFDVLLVVSVIVRAVSEHFAVFVTAITLLIQSLQDYYSLSSPVQP